MPVHALVPRFLEKVWGSHHLSPWFQNPSNKIGEVWLEGPNGEALPLLLKFLFTTENLSVQVHPNDEYAALHHQSKGKTEMWHILRAEPDARIALGLKNPLTADELREASESGAIEQMLNWIVVKPGDTFFVPAGTIHAVGAGVALCEIQQQSDITYRLYDYGRPRELHLDESIAVADLRSFVAAPQPPDCLVECQYFRTERLAIDSEWKIEADRTCWLICLEGQGSIDGIAYQAGQAFEVEAGTAVEIRPTRSIVFLRTFVP